MQTTATILNISRPVMYSIEENELWCVVIQDIQNILVTFATSIKNITPEVHSQ
jgi:hypothetical protein